MWGIGFRDGLASYQGYRLMGMVRLLILENGNVNPKSFFLKRFILLSHLNKLTRITVLCNSL